MACFKLDETSLTSEEQQPPGLRRQKQEDVEHWLPSLRLEVLADVARENAAKATGMTTPRQTRRLLDAELDPLAMQLVGLLESLGAAVQAKRAQDTRAVLSLASSPTAAHALIRTSTSKTPLKMSRRSVATRRVKSGHRYGPRSIKKRSNSCTPYTLRAPFNCCILEP